MIEFIKNLSVIQLVSILLGIALYVHFFCRCNFANHKKTPIAITLLFSTLFTCGLAIILLALRNDMVNLMLSLIIASISWVLLDLLLWIYGCNLSGFFESQYK